MRKETKRTDSFDEAIQIRQVHGEVRCKLGINSCLRVPAPVSHIFNFPSDPQ